MADTGRGDHTDTGGVAMGADRASHSFDLVSNVDLQEVRNAVQMAQKELATRFDFKGTSAGLDFELDPALVRLRADHDPQLRSVRDVLESKLAKRGVPLQSFVWKATEPLPSGGIKQQASLQQGLSPEQAKAIAQFVRGLGLKVQPRIEGQTVRVSARQIDDLQAVVRAVNGKDFGAPLQTENYR